MLDHLRPHRFALVVMLSLGVAACGNTSRKETLATRSSSSAAISVSQAQPVATLDYRKVDADKDNDVEAPHDDTNNNEVLAFGKKASRRDRHAIEVVVRRYYSAAFTENGTSACSLLYSSYEESVPEDYGTSPPGRPYMIGKTCPAVLTGLFKYLHAQLAVEVPKLKLRSMRIEGHHGVVLLTFGSLPERQVAVMREGHFWRLDVLLDGELP